MIKIMTINDQIRDEKLQNNINRKAAKISALSSAKFINMNVLLVKIYYHLIEQAKFTYAPLGKAFEKQIKTIEDQ